MMKFNTKKTTIALVASLAGSAAWFLLLYGLYQWGYHVGG